MDVDMIDILENRKLITLPIVAQRHIIECCWRIYWFNDDVGLKDRTKLALVSKQWFAQCIRHYNSPIIKRSFNPFKDDYKHIRKHINNNWCLLKSFNRLFITDFEPTLRSSFKDLFLPYESNIEYFLKLLGDIKKYQDQLDDDGLINNINIGINNNIKKSTINRFSIGNLFHKSGNNGNGNGNGNGGGPISPRTGENMEMEKLIYVLIEKLESVDIKEGYPRFNSRTSEMVCEVIRKIGDIRKSDSRDWTPITNIYNDVLSNQVDPTQPFTIGCKISQALQTLDCSRITSMDISPSNSLPQLLVKCTNLAFFVLRHSGITVIPPQHVNDIIMALPSKVYKIMVESCQRALIIPYELLTVERFPNLSSLFVKDVDERCSDNYINFLYGRESINDIRLISMYNETSSKSLQRLMSEKRNITMWYIYTNMRGVYPLHLHPRLRYLRMCILRLPSNMADYMWLQNLDINLYEVSATHFIDELAQVIDQMQSIQINILKKVTIRFQHATTFALSKENFSPLVLAICKSKIDNIRFQSMKIPAENLLVYKGKTKEKDKQDFIDILSEADVELLQQHFYVTSNCSTITCTYRPQLLLSYPMNNSTTILSTSSPLSLAIPQ